MYMEIVKYPDPFLNQLTENVRLPLDTYHENLVQVMIDQMHKNNGIGLAANQVGSSARIFVLKSNEPEVFVNPKIKKMSEETLTQEEGCLSCPGKFADVKRSIRVKLWYYDKNGIEYRKTFYDLKARIVQHEMDHLNGKLCIDSPILREKVLE